MDKPESRPRFRFSLRVLFLATIVVAVFCYWLILPTIEARRFVRAVESSDFAAADYCFCDPQDRFLNDYNKKFWTFELQATLDPFSMSEFWKRERRVTFHISYGGPGPLRIFFGTIIATSKGLSSPEVTGGMGGGMAI
jgi:hypothetical protein